jgi:hypothetical protein
MAYIPVNSTAEFVRLEIVANGTDYSGNVAAAFDTDDVLTVPALQDVTVNATPGTFRWKQLDSLSEKVVTIPSTNSVSVTMVLDDTAFFTGANNTPGIFEITNDKTETYFRLYWQGNTTGDKYIEGYGYLEALAPTVNPDAPVWTSPLTIAVTGDYITGTVPA